jgi:hypothetical protein
LYEEIENITEINTNQSNPDIFKLFQCSKELLKEKFKDLKLIEVNIVSKDNMILMNIK